MFFVFSLLLAAAAHFDPVNLKKKKIFDISDKAMV